MTMGKAGDELDKPDTGKKATNAETDAINKLEQEIAAPNEKKPEQRISR